MAYATRIETCVIFEHRSQSPSGIGLRVGGDVYNADVGEPVRVG
jgi:hypothetical protein